MAFRHTSLVLLPLALIALLLSACDRQPSVEKLNTELAGLLEREFKPGLFEILSVRRMGSTSTREKATGDQRMTVYFNAELRFRKVLQPPPLRPRYLDLPDTAARLQLLRRGLTVVELVKSSPSAADATQSSISN